YAWILDSGATTHICNDRTAFTTFTPSRSSIDRVITLRDVSYCPNVCNNLVSESRMDKRGLTITKSKGRVKVINSSGEVVIEGRLHNSLYELDC
ncbi:hypothetical protein OBBRIDRAFT_713029, partial [Obba rivulosa]